MVDQELRALLEQSFIVDDRPGAGSLIGAEYLKNAPADGYTLLLISNTHTVIEMLFAKRPSKPVTDFLFIAPINSSDLVLVTWPDLGIKTVAELIARPKVKPGDLTYTSSGPGTSYHRAGELF